MKTFKDLFRKTEILVKTRKITCHVPRVKTNANKFVVYPKFLKAVKSCVCQDNILLLSFVHSDTAFFIDWKLFCFSLSQFFDFWPECLDNVYLSHCFYSLDQIFFIIIFDAFMSDNFFFFEHANELIHMQICLTSFVEFMMVLNQTENQPFGDELLLVLSFENLGESPWKTLMEELFFLSKDVGYRKRIQFY